MLTRGLVRTVRGGPGLSCSYRSLSSLTQRPRALLFARAPGPFSLCPLEYGRVSRRAMSSTEAVQAVNGILVQVLGSYPVTSMAEALAYVHDTTGCSWAGTIVGAAVFLRFGLLLPAQVTSQKVAAKRVLLHKEMDSQLIPELQRATAFLSKERGWSEEMAKKKFNRAQRLMVKEKIIEKNCAASKLFLPFMIQIPIWITLSLAVRRLLSVQLIPEEAIMVRFLELSREGTMAFPNLTLADPTFILPLTVGLGFLLNNEINASRHHQDIIPKGFLTIAPNIVRVFSLWMTFVATIVPSAIALYWSASSLAALAVTLIAMSPRFRALVRIPKIPEYPDKPYSNVWINWGNKLRRLRARFQRNKE
ncbi:cytochrome c oxidase assembly protein COX18, mitochondrial-like isoform X2 [Tigriopus californicus]|nr:cytochrome c oxidase assembly protein COX18, mitochondrial-like isoform X2 [Tigriopus californicus]